MVLFIEFSFSVFCSVSGGAVVLLKELGANFDKDITKSSSHCSKWKTHAWKRKLGQYLLNNLWCFVEKTGSQLSSEEVITFTEMQVCSSEQTTPVSQHRTSEPVSSHSSNLIVK